MHSYWIILFILLFPKHFAKGQLLTSRMLDFTWMKIVHSNTFSSKNNRVVKNIDLLVVFYDSFFSHPFYYILLCRHIYIKTNHQQLSSKLKKKIRLSFHTKISLLVNSLAHTMDRLDSYHFLLVNLDAWSVINCTPYYIPNKP